MSLKRLFLIAEEQRPAILLSAILIVSLAAVLLGKWWRSPVPPNRNVPRIADSERPLKPVQGNVRTLQAAFARWKANHERNGGDRNVVLALGWSKALSAEFTKARGRARLNLIGGSVSVEVHGLAEKSDWHVWLVDNRPGKGQSVMPEPGDEIRHVGKLTREGGLARIHAQLGRNAFTNFDVDLVVISRHGQDLTRGSVLFGSPSLFHRLYRASQSQSAALGDRGRGGLFGALFAKPAYAASNGGLLKKLIDKGKNLFFNETFDGNGRTCGTCHPRENNLTIDPAFIATLPDDDPLFVAEFIPELAENFEHPELMRQFGLILENVDGFSDLEKKFVMRGVPHTLALVTSLAPAENFDGSTVPPVERTGWAGDGSPGDGSLRNFTTGAIIQHFTKTLNREPGVDFRLPTEHELDAIEAFMLSLGRQQDLDLEAIMLTNPDGETGRVLFNGPGQCFVCHFNAGANAGFTSSFDIPNGTLNFNFDTGIEDVLHPAMQVAGLSKEDMPSDGGFGTQNGNLGIGEGNGTFNTPPLVEAADTPPFFHNNLVNTIEETVDFYNSNAFKNSPSGQLVSISLSSDEVERVAAFLRIINADESLRQTIDLLQKSDAEAVKIARAEIEDGVEVLEGGPLVLHPYVVEDLQEVILALDEILADGQVKGQEVQELKELSEIIEESRAAMIT